LAADFAVDGSLDALAELPELWTVPVNSTFLPTCGWSAVGLAINRYIEAADEGWA
jgi:hypothetical protein